MKIIENDANVMGIKTYPLQVTSTKTDIKQAYIGM